MDSSTVMSSGFPPARVSTSLEVQAAGEHEEVRVCARVFAGDNTPSCLHTSYIQAIVTGKLCKRRHVVGVIGQVMGLLCDALRSLQDAVVVGILKCKKAMKCKLVIKMRQK